MAGAAGSAGTGGSAGKGGSGGATGGTAGTGGAGGTGGAAGSGGGTAGTGGAAGSPTIDAGTPDADASAPEASTPDARSGDGAVPSTDAGDSGHDAGTDSGGDAGVVPICSAPVAGCDGPNKSDAQIRAQFPQACSTTVGFRKCGGVYWPAPDNITETLPMLCLNGQWRLGGSWSGSQWVPSHNCSMGCAAGQLCNP
jgi:hypothetical protein